MKYGVNAFIWTANCTAEHLPLLEKIKAHGFDGVEFPAVNPGSVPTATLRKGLEANGLECTTCSIVLDGMSIFSEDAAVRERTLQHLRDCVRVTAELGGGVCAGPLYSPVGWLPGRRRTADEWKRAVESYQSLGGFLKEHRVKLAVEALNRFETFFLNTAADAKLLCDEVNDPNVGILFDTFHANIEEKDVAAALRHAGPRVIHIHTCENDRGTPGSGHVDWAGVFSAIRDIGYNDWLTIESFGFNIPEIAGAAAIWRDLAPSPEVIAFEGLKFLRSRTAA
jgi:D-psicose/D-tagatose/L-ribulose 3-epimerase